MCVRVEQTAAAAAAAALYRACRVRRSRSPSRVHMSLRRRAHSLDRLSDAGGAYGDSPDATPDDMPEAVPIVSIPVPVRRTAAAVADGSLLSPAASISSVEQHRSSRVVVEDPVATLKDVFDGVPVSCGFNIELKYPVDENAAFADVHAAERNAYLDAILSVVFEQCGERRIVFSVRPLRVVPNDD